MPFEAVVPAYRSSMDDELAPERNQRLTTALAEAGKALGLSVEREYPVPGGRIDVVWLWDGPEQFAVKLPLVGFEIESSWRTRKHLKGDLMNLVDLQPALGVIVLAGDGAKVGATRAFARLLVERHSARVEIWDEAQVAALGTGGSELRDLVEGLPVATTQPETNEVGGRKYAALRAGFWASGATASKCHSVKSRRSSGSHSRLHLGSTPNTGAATKAAQSFVRSRMSGGKPATWISRPSALC